MPKTPLAPNSDRPSTIPSVVPPTPAIAAVKPAAASVREPARTRIASGGVVPPPERAQPKPPEPSGAGARESRVGTRMQGTDGLVEPGAEAPKLRLTAGRVVPGTRYRILRWLGEGGMGVVYEAEHIDIERKVALKILRFDLSKQPRMVQVFRDEARAAGRLGSQYIVEIYDFGELPDGRSFFAMELLQGQDLVPSDTTVTMEPARVIGILRQICKGLHVAHKAKVVHRDVKPENLIATTEQGRADAMKIVDFGISSMLAAGNTENTIAGTPHYMAPEQVLGDAFDGRVDVYALGCTAYELITGTPPFDADSVEELLQLQLSKAPTSMRERRPDLAIPPALDRVILRCLAKHADDRYSDMADLEAALCEAQIEAKLQTPWDDLPLPELPDLERRERLLREMPTTGAMPGPTRNRWLWPLVAGASTLAAVSLGLFLAFGRTPPPAPAAIDRDTSQVDRIATQARDAAAHLDWVLPPPDAPDAPTAYRKVLELESEVHGEAETLAHERAGELRREFSTTLTREADRLWDMGAKVAATNLYLWAATFDGGNAHAFERAGIDAGFLADFVRRVKNGDLSQSELAMGLLAAAQASDDEAVRTARSEELDRAEEQLSPMVASVMGEELAVSGLRPRRKPSTTPVPTAVPTTVASADPLPDASVAESSTDAKAAARKKRIAADPRALLGNAERDPAKAKELAEQGLAALRAGRRSEASSLFNQSIAYDRSNAAALMGLSDIAFDTGADQKAVVYAEKAVEASPGNQQYRLKLGDAYFKVLRYRDALEQYEEAKQRGSTKADDRLARVKAKLGG
ncbi:MAG: protein kinase [Deltaproteobacteria bacterium]|nr:protein kinase [Deltaproteobacteria bacterium]